MRRRMFIYYFLHTIWSITSAVANSSGTSSIGRNGPYWDSFRHRTSPEAAKLCTVGTRQSPIDIPRSGNIQASFGALTFTNYDMVPSKYTLVNNGHTAKVSPVNTNPIAPLVNGGGLGSTFQFAQFHFHWGDESDVGSEHLIGGRAYPLEMHMVHFNTKYGSDLLGALGKGKGAFDTLAVFGVLFVVQESDNPVMDPIIKGLSSIKNASTETDIRGFPLYQLLPANEQSYYRYMGSLTTPLCNQIVIWTVYQVPVSISERQLEEFRSLQYGDESQPLVNTFRNSQPINGRIIMEVSSSPLAQISLSLLCFSLFLPFILTSFPH
ncbi:putative carbonic anhydrase 3 [Lepeophtheirus salmonis]|uniref:putative carbonic anhydrase 3 n=1 Tax=Lepeophtheirus salmonis TaxID=72036 RepID=UPI001AEAA521|nr:putative carbonic anhydrase 3 [Lepeophtheirus salmonis]